MEFQPLDSLAWELPYAAGTALKRKKKKKKKGERKKTEIQSDRVTSPRSCNQEVLDLIILFKRYLLAQVLCQI